MVNCSNCGFDVGESNFCPNCGTKVEKPKPLCPNCGQEIGDSKFCPNCGTKIEKETPKSFCPNCGEELNESSKFCPNCGYSKAQENSEPQNESNSTLDKAFDLDDKVSGKMSKLFGKSKIMDKTLDVSASIGRKYSRGMDSPGTRKYFEKIEPVFVEVYDSLDDDFVKEILLYERSMMGSSGSVVGIVAAQVYTPTKDMSDDEARKYYLDWAKKIENEINQEKQNGNFSEDEFYNKKVKQATLDNMSFFGVPKSVKAWKNNQK